MGACENLQKRRIKPTTRKGLKDFLCHLLEHRSFNVLSLSLRGLFSGRKTKIQSVSADPHSSNTNLFQDNCVPRGRQMTILVQVSLHFMVV